MFSSSTVTTGDLNSTWFPPLPARSTANTKLIFSASCIVTWTSFIPPDQSQERWPNCSTLLIRDPHYSVDVYTGGCALFCLPSIGSLIYFLPGLAYRDYGFRMSDPLRASQGPVGLKQENWCHTCSFVSVRAWRRGQRTTHCWDEKGMRYKAPGESELRKEVEIVSLPFLTCETEEKKESDKEMIQLIWMI